MYASTAAAKCLSVVGLGVRAGGTPAGSKGDSRARTLEQLVALVLQLVCFGAIHLHRSSYPTPGLSMRRPGLAQATRFGRGRRSAAPASVAAAHPSLTPLTTCRRELVLLMQIPVRCSCGTCAEWALIEFQVCRRFPRPVLGGRATQRVRPLPATPGRSRAHKRRQLGRPERGKPLRDSSGACSCVWTDASHWRCGLSTACSEWATCSWQRAAVPAAGGD